MRDDLDALLSQPLADVPDRGFSDTVMIAMELRALRRERRVTEILIGLVILLAMLLPFTGMGADVASLASNTRNLALLSLPLVAFVMLFSWKNFSR